MKMAYYEPPLTFPRRLVRSADGAWSAKPVYELLSSRGSLAIQSVTVLPYRAVFRIVHLPTSGFLSRCAFYDAEKLRASLLRFWIALADWERQWLCDSVDIGRPPETVLDKFNNLVLCYTDVMIDKTSYSS